MQDRLRTWGLPLIALLACALGAAREPWEQGIVLTALGGLLFLRPVSICVVPALPLLALASVLWAMTAFLPQAFFPLSDARQVLQNDYGFPAAWTITLQPWISLDACLLLGAGWLWILAAAGEGWRGSERRSALKIWCGGVLVLLAVSALAFFFHWDIPGWDSPRNFGPFANRNQMGNLLALGGFFMIVLAHETWERHQSVPWFWLGAAAAVFAGLVLNYSRGGIVLFLGAVGLWMLAMILMGGRIPMALVAGSIGLLFLSFFLVWGGDTLARFMGSELGIQGQGRPAIHRDAWKMAADVPLLGVGAGNFEALFPFYRETLQSEHRVLHPESDLLWLAAEMGMPAVLLVVAGLAVIAWSMFPFAPRSDRHLRAACLVGGLVFSLHGLVDVSGHRLGTVLPALLLFSMGVPSTHEPMAERRGLVGFGLAGALALMLAGLIWNGAALGWVDMPGRAARNQALEEAEEAIAAKEWRTAALATDRTLASAPLSWQGHYQQARLALAAGRPEREVRAAFLRAKALEPNNPWLSFRAGLMWWHRDRRDLALSYWNDALADARLHRGEVFNEITRILREIPGQEVRLAQMAGRFPDLRVYGLSSVSDSDFGTMAVKLAEGKDLAPMEAKALFESWERRNADPDFEAFLARHPEWMEQAWPLLARRLARRGDWDGTLRLLWERTVPPVWPKLDGSAQAVEKARLELRRNPLQVAPAYITAKEQGEGGRYDAALETLEPLLGTDKCPAYFHYMAAQFQHRLGRSEQAYASLEKYRRMTENP